MRTPSFLAAAVLLAIAAVACTSSTDIAKYRSIGRIQVMAQQLARQAEAAASGNADAFAGLSKERDAIAASLASLQPAEMNTLAPTWAKINAEVDSMLNGQKLAKDCVENADDFNAKVPVISSRMEEVVKIFAETSAGTKMQVMIASREMLLLDRMQRRIQLILQGGEEAQGAADGLQRDAQFFAAVLDGLIKGNDDLNLAPISNSSAKSILTDIASQWRDMEPELMSVIAAGSGLQDIHQAADTLQLDSQTLLLKAASLLAQQRN